MIRTLHGTVAALSETRARIVCAGLPFEVDIRGCSQESRDLLARRYGETVWIRRGPDGRVEFVAEQPPVLEVET